MPHIVAMGGGGFGGDDPDVGRLVEDFALGLTGRDTPRVCFIATASGDDPSYIEGFHAAFGGGRAHASHLGLFQREVVDLEGFLLGQDAIYVGGGNTANMLAVWRVHGVDRILIEAWRRDIVLFGLSAGGLCWFEGGSTDSFGPLAPLRDGMGFLPGSFCPHYDGEPERRPSYHRFIAEGMPAGYAADNEAALHFRGRDLAEAVAATPEAGAYRVSLSGGRVEQRRLPVRRLFDR
jgi:dipeptidase E